MARIALKRSGPLLLQEGSERRGSGLSLVEVVVALGLLGFGVLAVGAGQLASVRFNSESRLRTEAFYLAQQQMEAFRGMDADALDAQLALGTYPNDVNNPIDPDPTDALPRAYSRSWSIAPNTPEGGLYTLRVQVSWVDNRGRNRNVRIGSVSAGI